MPPPIVTTVVDKHKDLLRDYLEASKRNMQYHIAEAIAAKRYNHRNRGQQMMIGGEISPVGNPHDTSRSTASKPWSPATTTIHSNMHKPKQVETTEEDDYIRLT